MCVCVCARMREVYLYRCVMEAHLCCGKIAQHSGLANIKLYNEINKSIEITEKVTLTKSQQRKSEWMD